MQNKKLLSVCLSVLLVCLCAFGTLCLSANAATSVLFTVNGTDNASENQYVSLEAALNAASAKTDWLATDELTIEVSTSAVEADVLGIDPILVEGNALPIIIKGGSLSFANDVFCKNDVTFEGTIIAFASDVDFVSAGNVALKGCTVTGTAEFFADGAAASSLTFENTNFGGTVYATGKAESVSADATATVTVKGTSEVSAIAVRKDGAEGYARNAVLNVEDSAKTAVAGVGTAPAGTFNVELNVSGGTVSSVNATGLGEATMVVNNITGGTVTDFMGTSGIAQSVTNSVSGGTVTNFYGSSSDLTVTGEIGSITNNFTGGKITNFYGSGNSTATATAYSVGSIVNNLTGGSFASDALYGTGHNAYAQNVTNNLNGTGGKSGNTTKFYPNFGIFNTASTPKLTGEGMNVKGTLTNNYVKASGYHTVYNVAAAIDGDLVVNTGDPNYTGGRYSIQRVTGSYAASIDNMVVGGNFTFNASNSNMSAEWTILSNVTVRGNASIYANNISAGSHFRLAAGMIGGNFTAVIENSDLQGNASAERYFQGPGNDVGGSISWTLKNVNTKTYYVFEPIAANQDGDVSIIFDNTTIAYASYAGVIKNVGGTLYQELKGKNPFVGNKYYNAKSGVTVGGFENVIGDGIVIEGTFNGSTCATGKVVNRIGNATFNGLFSGTNGSADEVENYINGGVFNCTSSSRSFWGTNGKVTKVTNYIDAPTMTAAENMYLTNGESAEVNNYFYALNKPGGKGVYGSQGHSGVVNNYFMSDDVIIGVFRGSAGAGTGTTAQMRDDLAYEVNNYIFGGKFGTVKDGKLTEGTFWGADGKKATFPLFKKVRNYIYDGDFFTFYGGGQRGQIYEIENYVYGNVNFADAMVAGSSGSSMTENTLDVKCTTVFGSEDKPYTGTVNSYRGGASNPKGSKTNTSVTTVNGGTFNAYHGGSATSDYADHATDIVVNNINGGTFGEYYGSGKSKFSSLTNNITGGTFETIFSGSDSVGENVYNNISGGTVKCVYYGTKATATNVETVLSGDVLFEGDSYLTGTTATNVISTVEGGTFNGSMRGAGSVVTNLTCYIKGGAFKKSFIGAANSADSVEIYMSGGSTGDNLYGAYGSKKVGSIYIEVTDGKIGGNFVGSRSDTTSVVNVIKGGTIKEFRGTYSDAGVVVGKVTNRILGGTVTGNFWANGEKSIVTEVVNEFTGGTIGDAAEDIAYVCGPTVTKFSNNFDGTTFVSILYATSYNSDTYNNMVFDSLVNDFKSGTYGSIYATGSGAIANSITNNIGEVTINGTFYGTGSGAEVTTITNNVNGATFGKFYGTNGTCGTVYNNFTAGTFGDFYGTNGASDTVYNTFDGEFTFNANTYLTNGTTNLIVNNFFSVNFTKNTYGCQGHFNKVVNNFREGSKASAFRGAAGMGSTNTVSDSNRMKDEYAYEIENNVYSGANLNTLYGVDGKYAGFPQFRKVTNNLYDGAKLAKLYGGGQRGFVLDIVNNVYGSASITDTFYGGSSGSKVPDTEPGYATTITNNFGSETVPFTGTIKKFYGGQQTSAGILTCDVVNNVYSGNFSTFYGGGAGGKATTVVNNIMGGNISTFLGGGTAAIGSVVNNFSPDSISTFYGGGYGTETGFKIDYIENNIADGLTFKYFNGGSLIEADEDSDGNPIERFAEEGKIINNINNITITGSYYGGGYGPADYVENNINGGVFAAFYGTRVGVTEVVNNFTAGEFTTFNGTRGTCDKVTNTFDGEFTFKDNVYLTNGTTNQIINEFHKVNFTKNTYGCQGHFNKVVNNFYEGSQASAFRGAAGMGNTNTTKDADRMKDEYAYEIENNVYSGANLSSLYGADGKYAAFPQFRKVTNNVYDGAVIATFYGGGQRGIVLEIVNNIYGNATFTKAFYGGSSGSKIPATDTIYETKITNNIGTEAEPYTGTISTFRAGQSTVAGIKKNTVVTKIYGGEINTFYGGSVDGDEIIETITTEIYGANLNNFSASGEATTDSASTVIADSSIKGTVSIKDGDELLLTGTINVYTATSITATKVEDVILVQNETWQTGKEYLVVVGGTAEGEVTAVGAHPGTGDIYFDPYTGGVVGLSFAKSSVLASLSLQERIQIKIWLPKVDVDTWIKSTNSAFEYQAVVNVNGQIIKLGSGKITAPHAADISSLTSAGVRTDYYVVTFSGVGAANFDKVITVSGSFFSVDTTVMTLANAGVQLYKGAASENLFKAIYDYGAACTNQFTKYDELPCTSNVPASVVTPSSNAALSYDHVEALMEDAVGIRFVMNKGASFDPAQLVLKLDGVVMKKDIEYAVTVAGDKVYVDVYFKAKHMSTDFELVIEAGGARALYYASSVERTVSEISKANRRDQVLQALMAYVLQVKAYNI